MKRIDWINPSFRANMYLPKGKTKKRRNCHEGKDCKTD
nr:MAG TPA: hypothetical protein [Caudoviricetes sp.]